MNLVLVRPENHNAAWYGSLVTELLDLSKMSDSDDLLWVVNFSSKAHSVKSKEKEIELSAGKMEVLFTSEDTIMGRNIVMVNEKDKVSQRIAVIVNDQRKACIVLYEADSSAF